MHVIMVGIQEVAVVDDEIKHRVARPVRLRRIATENVVDGASVVFPGRGLAVAVVVEFAARVSQPFNLIALR